MLDLLKIVFEKNNINLNFEIRLANNWISLNIYYLLQKHKKLTFKFITLRIYDNYMFL